MCCLFGCCECIVKLLWGIIAFAINSLITLVIIVCTVSFIVWAMLRHGAVKFQVSDAELTQFTFDPDSTNLHYNLSLVFSIRNSNSRLGIHYDRFDARVYYDHQRLAASSVPPFYQGHKSTVVVGTVFQGQNLVLLGGGGRGKFEDEKRSGVYGIDVELKLRARLMFGLVNTWRFKPRVLCGVKVQLSSSDSARGSGFQPTDCHIHF
ncbi:Late embryogenesis abundant (LEA) hydroxyproline-rich glycoprotein family [Raphanus sativus]|uniref:NDR1/HIN1-like protein 3 n=1 Tax=Raphanus sativus TaxID=3726 RepID=A0A6J0M7C3_RAPSA|nr:NDR1/HIN1-like protein 3 [Raphanus sativus]KAJ4911876.1 Late embryogenesis abundant (LEA) hydroxyproline-rich glycoprotein family [Raphanus sativus]